MNSFHECLASGPSQHMTLAQKVSLILCVLSNLIYSAPNWLFCSDCAPGGEYVHVKHLHGAALNVTYI